jgi:hypothetical protein
MMVMNFKEMLIQLLKGEFVEKYNSNFQQAFLDYASSTEDNLACAKKIILGRINYDSTRKRWGLKLKKHNVTVSDIINTLESEKEVPKSVKDYYPDLSLEDWHTALRITTVILVSLEQHSKD